MRKFLIGLIIVVCVAWVFIYEPFRGEPPTPKVMVGDEKIPTTKGSYCWDGILISRCADMAFTGTIDMARNHEPTTVSPGAKIEIQFSKEPMDGLIEVEKWIDEETHEAVELKDGMIKAPLEEGFYVYRVRAEWKRGNGNDVFSIKVK